MRIVTNDKLIASRARLGQISSFVGLGLLFIALFLSIQNLIWPAYGALIVGFILSQIGMYFASKWVRQPRADQTLVKALKGLDQRHTLYNYFLPAEHVLVAPYGVFVFQVQDQDGEIRYLNNRWQQRFSWRRFLRRLGQIGLGNPTREAQASAAKVSQWFASHESLAEAQVPIAPVVIFVNPDAQLDVVNPPLPVLTTKGMKSLIRQAQKENAAIPANMLQEIEKVCDAKAA